MQIKNVKRFYWGNIQIRETPWLCYYVLSPVTALYIPPCLYCLNITHIAYILPIYYLYCLYFVYLGLISRYKEKRLNCVPIFKPRHCSLHPSLPILPLCCIYVAYILPTNCLYVAYIMPTYCRYIAFILLELHIYCVCFAYLSLTSRYKAKHLNCVLMFLAPPLLSTSLLAYISMH